jgi:hypothetical protein
MSSGGCQWLRIALSLPELRVGWSKGAGNLILYPVVLKVAKKNSVA